jgi:hypothetical protein
VFFFFDGEMGVEEIQERTRRMSKARGGIMPERGYLLIYTK